MAEEFQLHKTSRRGDEAKQLLESPLLAEAFAQLKTGYLNQLMDTDVTQSDFRDKCWMAARVVDVVKDHLVKVVNNGSVAKSDLEMLKKEADRKKRYGIM